MYEMKILAVGLFLNNNKSVLKKITGLNKIDLKKISLNKSILNSELSKSTIKYDFLFLWSVSNFKI